MRQLNSINDVWVYDNPDTGLREMYKHGHLVIHFPEEALLRNGTWWPWGDHRWVQEMYWADMQSLGPYDEGHEWGDRIHKPFDPLANQLYDGQDLET